MTGRSQIACRRRAVLPGPDDDLAPLLDTIIDHVPAPGGDPAAPLQALVTNLAAEVLQDLTPVDIAIAPDDNIIVALPAPGLDGFGLLERLRGAPDEYLREMPFVLITGKEDGEDTLLQEVRNREELPEAPRFPRDR